MSETDAIIYVIAAPIYLFIWGAYRKSSSWLWFISGGVFAWIYVLFAIAGLATLTGAL